MRSNISNPPYHGIVFTRLSKASIFNYLLCFSFHRTGLLRLQQIYQGLRPGNETFQVETVKRITNATNAIEFLKTLEDLNRWSKKYIVLDCPTDMAKDIVVYHVRDLSLGRRTYHYLFSGLVSLNKRKKYCFFFHHSSITSCDAAEIVCFVASSRRKLIFLIMSGL